MSKSIIDILLQLSALLEKCNESDWANYMEMLADKLRVSPLEVEKKQEIFREILHLYGGMGSFQDLVLHTGKKMIDDNRKLAKLRKELFESARNQLK